MPGTRSEEDAMGDPRPIPDEETKQDEQAALIRRTDNGPTEENEEALLAEEFGEPDAAGLYGAPAGDEEADR
ncbi:hypothetical protein ACFQZ2_01825 [Streptomonospora algeriensis]|uniref:DUF5709 domain-containing protein n=1 Tax=Streptomonospora algeriensis TaxID=995084 RepID=A0ABW3BC18_9ACTN